MLSITESKDRQCRVNLGKYHIYCINKTLLNVFAVTVVSVITEQFFLE